MQVTALVIGDPITFQNLQDLNFGIVPRGAVTTVLRTSASAGTVRATGTPNAFAQIQLTLPTQLPNIQALPGISMAITFGATSAAWNRATNDAGGATIFNPASPTTGRFGPPPRPYLFVYLGGTVNPTPTQAPGIYQGTIILTITYL